MGSTMTGTARLSDGLQGYQSAIASTYAPMVVAPASPGRRYSWSVSGKRCGSLDLSHIIASGPIRAQIPHVAESPAASKIILSFVADGAFEFEQAGRHAVCGPQSLTLMDIAKPLEAAQHGPVDLLSVIIPRDFLRAYIPHVELACTNPIPATSGGAAVLRDLVKSSWRESRGMGSHETLVMPQVFASMIYSVFVGANDRELSAGRSVKLTLFRDLIQHVIDHELRNPELGPVLIAERLNISKSYLFVIARKLNTSIQQWIIDRRLDACRAALQDPVCSSRTITDVAFSWGFKDAAHFSRRFSQRFGVSPKEYRRQAN